MSVSSAARWAWASLSWYALPKTRPGRSLAGFARRLAVCGPALALAPSAAEEPARPAAAPEARILGMARIHQAQALALADLGFFVRADELLQQARSAQDQVLLWDDPAASLVRLQARCFSSWRASAATNAAAQRQTLEQLSLVVPPSHPSILVATEELAEFLLVAAAYDEADTFYRFLADRASGPAQLGLMNRCAVVAMAKRRFDEAAALLRQVLDRSSRVSAAAAAVFEARCLEALLCSFQGDRSRARALLEALLEDASRDLPPQDRGRFRIRALLAAAVAEAKDHARADALLEAAPARIADWNPRRQPLYRWGRLGSTPPPGFPAGARDPGAVPSAREAIEKLLGPDVEVEVVEESAIAPGDPARQAGLEAELLDAKGDPAGAARGLEQAIELRAKLGLQRDLELVELKEQLCEVLPKLGQLDRLLGLRRELLESERKEEPLDEPRVVDRRWDVARALEKLGQLDEAQDGYRGIVARLREKLDPYSGQLLAAEMDLARVLEGMGRLQEVVDLRRALVEKVARRQPTDLGLQLRVRTPLARSWHLLGQYAQAAAECRAILGLLRDRPASDPNVLWARMALASALLALGDLPECRGHLEAALERYERKDPEDPAAALYVRRLLGILHRQGERYDEALRCEEQGLRDGPRALPEDHAELQSLRASHAVTLETMGRLAEALRWQREVLRQYQRSLPATAPAIRAASQEIERLEARIKEK